MPKSPKSVPPADWQGWQQPEYTPIPDALFDVWLPLLTEGQLKVLLYIMRRTFGFKKQADAISLSQLCDGIVTADGRRLDTGTGCTRSTVTAAVAALVDYGLISATAQTAARGDAAPTIYRLRMAQANGGPINRPPKQVKNGSLIDGLLQSNDQTTPGSTIGLPVVQPLDPQETAVQDTVIQEDQYAAELQPEDTPPSYSPWIAQVIVDYSREMDSLASTSTSVDRALRLWRSSGLAEGEFVDRMQQAKLSLRKAQGSRGGVANKIVRFFDELTKTLAAPKRVEQA